MIIKPVNHIVLVLIVAAGLLSAVAYKSQIVLKQTQIDAQTERVSDAILPLKRIVDLRMADLRAQLLKVAVKRETRGQTRLPAEFDVVVLAAAETGGHWTPKWVEGQRSDTAQLTASLPLNKVREGEITWYRLIGEDKRPVLAMMVPVEIPRLNLHPSAAVAANDVKSESTAVQKAVVIGLSTQNPLAGVVEDLIGTDLSAYVVDDRGFVSASTGKGYLGQQMRESPVVHALLRDHLNSNSGHFVNLQGEQEVAHYEKVEHTNLYTVIAAPEVLSPKVLRAQMASILSSGLGFAFLALIVTYFFGLFGSGSKTELAAATAQPAVDPKLAQIAVSQQVRSESLRQLSYGFSKFLSGPLTAILAQARLIESKSTQSEIRGHATQVHREADVVLSTLARVREFSSTAELTTRKFSLVDCLEAALKDLQNQLSAKGVDLQRHFQISPYIKGDATALKCAFTELLENSVKSLQGRDSKHVSVTVVASPSGCDIEIRDTGVGMPKFILDRATEPFFTGFLDDERLGLGLASADGILQRHGILLDLQSTPGTGTKAIMHVPREIIVAPGEAVAADVAQADTTQPNSKASPDELLVIAPQLPQSMIESLESIKLDSFFDKIEQKQAQNADFDFSLLETESKAGEYSAISLRRPHLKE